MCIETSVSSEAEAELSGDRGRIVLHARSIFESPVEVKPVLGVGWGSFVYPSTHRFVLGGGSCLLRRSIPLGVGLFVWD